MSKLAGEYGMDIDNYIWANVSDSFGVYLLKDADTKHCTKRNYPLKVDRLTLKRYVMWYIALHILLDNLFLHILTPHLP